MFVKSALAGILCITSLLAQAAPDEKTSKAKIKEIETAAKQGQGSVDAITAYQRDPDVKVRLEVVNSLIQVGGPKAADALRVSCEDGSGEIQRLSVAGILNFYKPGYIKQGWKAKLGESIQFGSSPEVLIDPYVTAREQDITAIRKVLVNGASREAKLMAGQALAAMRAKSALPDFYPLLKSKDSAFMASALRAIETSGDKAAAQETVFLVRDLDDKIQARAIAINGLYLNEGALPDLAEVFARGRSAKSKSAALQAIAMIASPDSKGLFTQNLAAKDPALRGLAAEGLARINATDQLDEITKLMDQETSARARLGQAFALVKFGKRETADFSPLSYLLNTLNSAAWGDYSVAYLRELSRDGEVRNVLRSKIPTANRAEKIGIAKILGYEGNADDRAALDALSHDRDSDVAQEGIKAARMLNARLP